MGYSEQVFNRANALCHLLMTDSTSKICIVLIYGTEMNRFAFQVKSSDFGG